MAARMSLFLTNDNGLTKHDRSTLYCYSDTHRQSFAFTTCNCLLYTLTKNSITTMGTSMSTSAGGASLSAEHADIKFLGDRMPFGDAELIHVYRSYQAMKAKTSEDRISFLTDIGYLSVPSPEQEERMVLLQAVEHKILSPNFGNRLYETSFLPKGHVSEYQPTTNHDTSATTVTVTPDEYTKRVQLEAFFDALSNSGRRGVQHSLKILFDCCQPQTAKETPTTPSGGAPPPMNFAYAGGGGASSSTAPKRLVDPLELVTIGYRVGLASAFLSADASSNDDVSRFFPVESTEGASPKEAGLQALANSLIDMAQRREQRTMNGGLPLTDATKSKKFVGEEDVYEWAEQVAPMFGSALATLIHSLFFPHRPYPPSRTRFDFPSLAEFDSTFFTQGSSSPLLFSFGCMSPALGGEYYRLYTSASDGLSFNRLQNALLGYGGPTLIIIESGKSLFGAFTASPWKESKDFYGNHDCFLYRLMPTTSVYRPSGSGKHFMYCNSFARSRGYDKQAHGIGFGGTVDRPRLFLAENFDDCRAASQDLTFENGRLLDTTGAMASASQFEIDHLEVWGVGGTEVVQEALGARRRQRDIKHAAIQKARKVDKAAFLDDFRSGVIESKAFAHRQQIQGREGLAIGEEDLKNDYGK